MNRKLNVIIDARMVNKKLHGIARYTFEIIRNISSKDNISITLLVNDLDLSKRIFYGFNNIKFIKVKSKFLSVTEQVELPMILNKYTKDAIFHSPSFVSSPLISCPMIMTIHDLNHLKFPNYYSPFHKYYYEFIVKRSALKCKSLLTVSEFSKRELVEWLKCDESKITVAYNGVDEKFEPITDSLILVKIKHKYNLPNNFVLYIGNFKPHKNIKTLIKAMAYIKKSEKLVVNGRPDKELYSLITQYNLKDKIQFIGYIDENDLPVIYNLADIFVFPSLYEGFGLPPLEAMACGCPVIVANTSSLPEVTKNATIKVEPFDYIKMAKKIDELLDNQKEKEVLIKNGIEVSKNYLWKSTAEQILCVYQTSGD